MARLPYTYKRGGLFQIQVRVTGFSGRKWLVRFSLGTPLCDQAQQRVIACLGWLFLMQNPAAFSANIDLIFKRIADFAEEGPVKDLFQASQRRHFLEVAYRMLQDWRAARPCPVTYSTIYAHEKELVEYLAALGKNVCESFATFGNPSPDFHYLNPPEDPFGYMCGKDGIVTAVLPWVLDRWPELRSMPEELRPQPRYKGRQNRRVWIARPLTRKCEGVVETVARSGDLYCPNTRFNCGIGSAGRLARHPASRRSRSGPRQRRRSEAGEHVRLARFLSELAQEAGGSRSADRDIAPYVGFWVHVLGDRPSAEYTRDDARLFCEQVSEIPHPYGMEAKTPVERYEHAREHGWAGLRRLTTTTVENRYFSTIRRQYAWTREAGLHAGPTPKLKVMGKKVLTPLNKDAFSDDEVRKLFGQPVFTGQQKGNSYAPGPFLKQSFAYWGYLILFLAGIRPGEIAQLLVEDVREFEGILYFDLCPFDQERGRVALADAKTLKSENANRLVPLHPLLVELGLVDRASKLKALGHTRLFPDWIWRILSDGKVKHGDALARDWQKRKKLVTSRKNVSAYSGRHSTATLLDDLAIPQRDRERILGHSHPGISGRYGRKGALSDRVVAAFLERDDPTLLWLRKHLNAARDRAEDAGKLIEDWAAKA